MAQMPFSGYQPLQQPGAYSFERPGQSPLVLGGPAAEQLKRQIDTYKSLAPQPTAQLQSVDPMQGGMSRSVSDVPAPTPAVERPKTPEEIAKLSQFELESGAPPGSLGGDPNYVQKKVGGLDASAKPQDPNAPKPKPETPVQGGAAPAVGNGMWVQVRPGVMFNTQTQEIRQTQGAGGASQKTLTAFQKEADAERERLAQVYEDAKKRRTEEAAIRMGEAQAEQDFAKEQARLAEEAKWKAAVEANDLAEQAKNEKAAATKLYDEYTGSKVDEGRIFRGGAGTGRALMGALAIGLGGFGNALRSVSQVQMGQAPQQQENRGLSAVMRTIDNDIRQQENEIRLKGAKADNALAQYARTTGDLASAKQMLRATQIDYAQKQANEIGMSAKSPLIQNQLGDVMAGLEQEKLNAIRNHDALVIARMKAMRGGGPGPVTIQDLEKVQKFQQGQAQTEATEVGTTGKKLDNTKAAVDLQNPEQAKAKNLSAEEKKYATSVRSNWETLKNTVREMGGQLNPDGTISGNIDLPNDIPGGDTEDTAKTKASFTALGTSYANTINAGAEAGQPTKEALTPKLGTFTNSTGMGQLKAMAEDLARRMRDTGQSTGSAGVQRAE